MYCILTLVCCYCSILQATSANKLNVSNFTFVANLFCFAYIAFIVETKQKLTMIPGRDILPETSVLFVCDVQEKFRPHAGNFDALVEVIRRTVSDRTFCIFKLYTVIIYTLGFQLQIVIFLGL